MLLNVYGRYPVTFVKGEGLYLYDDQGQKYLDFVSGIAVNGLGHSHPKMVEAVKKQADTLFHVSNLYHNDAQTELAKNITDKTAFERVFFCNSGAEANELALKIARKFGNSQNADKNVILYMNNSFHGRTTGTLAVTGQVKYQQDFVPLMPRTEACDFNNIEALKAKFNDNVCAVILEPIQGEGGLSSASVEYLKEIRALCDQHNALLIFDEIQCGMGRTGSLLVCERIGVLPDVITVAKALGGGLPIGACMTRGQANEVMKPGDHGSTYGGNPFVCRVANTILEELTTGGVIDHVNEIAPYAIKKLEALQAKYPTLIEGLRGEGLLLGLKMTDKVEAGEVVKKALEEKLLLVPAGGNVVRYFPALIVTEKEIDESIVLLEKTLNAFL